MKTEGSKRQATGRYKGMCLFTSVEGMVAKKGR